ncbi:ribonuclease E/G [Novosphingobium album (ex Hu et al. 2023)]|uniref:Ribonuclease E/G n=1 Tax=Novosphingobium album (ex Hu et al. 2023) TaxID=2930093 RepID=A0ABT0B3F8_9SPHN|nr:ribonuclease E/G [Novosphingobium album (ex Hu et al. 2023)]MCJ2179571.1 ribonuclease E/G [Novosphingobium album (ex Hu et al. 2023)]
MPEWLVEEGIGESRAILIEGGDVLAARLEWPGHLSAGEVAEALLVSRRAGSPRGTVRFASGEEALVDGLAASASEGAPVRVQVTRSAMAETGRFKRAQARACSLPVRPAPALTESLSANGLPVRTVRRFPDDPWPELIGEALDGVIAFDGGALVVTPTPAMTLIDIDGTQAPRALALAAVPAIARAIGQLDLAGSIGIDFPSLERKDDRRMVDEALAAALDHWPHQRTAMNGFGFVQLVSRLERPSILQRVRSDPAGAAARLLLRQAEMVSAPGRLLLTVPSSVRTAITPQWESELARRTGRSLQWSEEPGLALTGGFAQAVTP